jgi:lipopolysaccharide export system protein LptC
MALVQAERLSDAAGAIARTEARTARAFASARRHSRLVRLLRIVLPLGSLGSIGFVVALTLFRTFGPQVAGLSIGEMSVDGTKITMGKPRLTGGRPDGSGYVINAEKAIQDISHPTEIELFQISGDIGQRDQAPMKLSATQGLYNSTSENLKLSGVVRLKNSKYTVNLKSAEVDFKAGLYLTHEPIDVITDKGMTIQADSATARDNASKLTFDGHVKTEIPPQGGDQEPAPEMKNNSQ